MKHFILAIFFAVIAVFSEILAVSNVIKARRSPPKIKEHFLYNARAWEFVAILAIVGMLTVGAMTGVLVATGVIKWKKRKLHVKPII